MLDKSVGIARHAGIDFQEVQIVGITAVTANLNAADAVARQERAKAPGARRGVDSERRLQRSR